MSSADWPPPREPGKKPLFHHCASIEVVLRDEIVPSPHWTRSQSLLVSEEMREVRGRPEDKDVDEHFADDEVKPNAWLRDQVGFYPLFLGVGDSLDAVQMTNYPGQWRDVIGGESFDGKWKNTRRRKGKFPNYVLLSYEDLPGVVFLDYDDWFLILNSSHNDYKITDRERRMVLKPSWRRSDWLRKVRRQPGSVMAVIPRLRPRDALQACVRNEASARLLRDSGFANVARWRVRLGDWA